MTSSSSIDEELELEFDDQRLDSILGPIAPAAARDALDRRTNCCDCNGN